MTIPWWGLIPFITMLLCIAVLPLVKATSETWEKNTTKLTVSLILGLPVIAWMWISRGYIPILETTVEYLSFIVLLFGLFVVSGGIFLAGDIRATPKNNTIFMAIGGFLASFIGTTGAAMLLIRPILNTNKQRDNKVHTVIFTILIVANCGGLLTPLGDPPLFLGYLAGVPFAWTFSMTLEWAFILALLLITYYCYDCKMYAKEHPENILEDKSQQAPIRVNGALNFVWFAVIICAVAFNIPSVNVHAIESAISSGYSPNFLDCIPWRELVILAASAASYLLTSQRIRFEKNEFSWSPIIEVAVLFIGIFATMIPALLYLEQIAHKLPLNAVTFFWFTGVLSAFLDNAPTYKTFFEMGIAAHAANPSGLELLTLNTLVPRSIPVTWLNAISLGSVTCGALTYIGNGPNFMTKSVAESRGVKMPSFLHYIWWTVKYLLPVLIALVLVFIADGVIWHIIGWIITAAILARGYWYLHQGKVIAANKK